MEGEDELYASDAEEEEEEERGRGGAAVLDDGDDYSEEEDGGVWVRTPPARPVARRHAALTRARAEQEMRPAHGRAAAAEPSYGEPDDADDYDEDEEDDDDAALVVQGLQRRQQTGACVHAPRRGRNPRRDSAERAWRAQGT